MIEILEKAQTCPLTEMEKEILNFFIDDPKHALYMNLEEISHALYTSNATIVRFCKKIGLNGYHEFKYEVRKELEQQQNRSLSSQDLMDNSLACFADNLDAIDLQQLEAISELMCSPQPLYIYGAGLSSIPAKYLQTILTTLDRPCILIEWRHLLEGITYSINKDSILFLITAHGDAPRYLQIFETAKNRGTTIVLITCDEESPLPPYCDYTIITSDENKEFHNIDINPRIGILTVIQILIEMVAQRCIDVK